MKLSSSLLVGLLCAGMLIPGACPAAMADAGPAAESCAAVAEPCAVVAEPSAAAAVTVPTSAPKAGTGAESRDYARREAQSPEVQEFQGGDGVFIGGGLLLLILVVVLIVILLDE